MDDYPAYSLEHNVPLLVAIGLPSPDDKAPALDRDMLEQATLLRSDFPLLDGAHASAFRRYIASDDSSLWPWKGRASPQRYIFRIRAVGREYYLPPRRARLPEGIDPPASPLPLHSPYSPLSPSCSLYPDGIIDAQWIQKHQEQVPSVFLCFYSLSSDPVTATLLDNKIRDDISTLKRGIQQSGYRSRLAVGIFTQDNVSSTDGTQDRLENIRRGSGVDSKLFFAVSGTASEEELERVAENMLTTINVQAMEYYRDLGRHSRKKRGRGSAPQPSVPPTSGTSQTLSLAGWQIRYDFKSAILAEFRQEMDVALRLLEQAYASLLGPDVLDIIPSWSPRWNQARLLADVMAIRCLRCLLANGQYTAAVRRWQQHQDRIRGIVDSRGHGTNNYGWKAWEARWTLVMANLVERLGIGDLHAKSKSLFLRPEKAVLGEKLLPWEHLHHNGYWFRLAAKHLYARRSLAYAIPDDDRCPPDTSSASKVASRSFTYDDYMCPPPHEEYPLDSSARAIDHSRMILTCLEAARGEFLRHHQDRFAAEVSLECGREYITAKNWAAAFKMLSPLWSTASYRAEAWFNINEELAWTLRAVSKEMRRPDLIVAIDWELLDSRYTRRKGWSYDVAKALDSLGETGPTDRVSVKLKNGRTPSFLSASFAFKRGQGKAGETETAQLSITSNAFAGSPAIVLESAHVVFQGIIKPVWLKHGEGGPAPSRAKQNAYYSVVDLEEKMEAAAAAADEKVAKLVGTADLTLYPQSTSVYEFSIPLHEAGDVRAMALELVYSCQTYRLLQTIPLQGLGRKMTWYLSATTRTALARAEGQAIHILPRPPKMELTLLPSGGGGGGGGGGEGEGAEGGSCRLVDGLWTAQFYINETVDIGFGILNAETFDASTKLDVVMTGGEEGGPLAGFTLFLEGEEIDVAEPRGGGGNGDEDEAAAAVAAEAALHAVPLGVIAANKTVRGSIHVDAVALPTSFDMVLSVVYHLAGDPATPIVQALPFKLELSNPFEANYDLLPRLHPDPWPSVFDPDGILPLGKTAEGSGTVGQGQQVPSPHGLAQAWTLISRYASFATEDLCIVDLGIAVAPVRGIACHSTRRLPGAGEFDGGKGILIMKPKTMEEAHFDISVQKDALENRDAAQLDVSFVIRWRRTRDGGGGSTASTQPQAINTTSLPVPRLAIFGPEPRVLASASYAVPTPGGSGRNSLVFFHLAIENPTHHFLTFGLSMEPSNEFAFSGSKMTTLHVLPVSRRTVSYRLLPLVRGAWIKPALTVRDKYFQKVLRVLPTEGLKLDKDGILIWVPPDRETDEDNDSVGQEE